MYQRSADIFVCIYITSYIMLYFLEILNNTTYKPDKLNIYLEIVIYNRHIEAVHIIDNEPYIFPTIKFNKNY